MKVGEQGPPAVDLNLLICDRCKFVQLDETVETDLLYSNYWYRSGTNQTMTDHLLGVVEAVSSLVPLAAGDIVIDIGCNDGTLLKHYPRTLRRVGVDPSDAILEIGDENNIIAVNDYFSYENVAKSLGYDKAKIITSISMFYDLDDPSAFVDSIEKSLHEDGVWVVEMNYTGWMLDRLGYDMISHEHVAYYTLSTFETLLKHRSLQVFDISFNEINGGSIRIFVGREKERSSIVQEIRNLENGKRL